MRRKINKDYKQNMDARPSMGEQIVDSHDIERDTTHFSPFLSLQSVFNRISRLIKF